MTVTRPAAPSGWPVGLPTTPPSWSTSRQAVSVVAYRPHPRQTSRVALVVGTVIFAINQLDLVLRHEATIETYLKGALTYLVPFCVSNFGILVATRRVPGRGRT